MKKVAIQGQRASFHDIAARYFFGDEDIAVENCPLPFRNVFESLKNGDSEYAVVAIENSLYGSINEVYDLLLEYQPYIIGEVYLHISQNLVGLQGALIQDIKKVHSHPIALAQCEEFLDKELSEAERFEHSDTAGSISDVKKWSDTKQAAIGSRAAADLHGLSILAEDIETNKHNYTRFVILSGEKKTAPNADKTSIILNTPADTKAGSLYQALGTFAKRNLNLLMLQSRPIIGKAWHYMFYLDIAASVDYEDFQAAVQELESQGCDITILGSYKNTQNQAYKA